ncbi:winged helix-turn-helix transcriptional regulator [Deinococcus sp.]|uniref:winged helix-turn-helix transcriptional regulator n=1 Tax=Deinococcus sp. TaxID=47478 RepID=UPI003CC5AB4B
MLDIIGHRWTALIVWHLSDGAKRHAQLAALLPRVTAKVLTERLRTLERLGVVERVVYPEVPPRVEYTLTPHGRRLSGILDELEAWGKDTATLGLTSFRSAD